MDSTSEMSCYLSLLKTCFPEQEPRQLISCNQPEAIASFLYSLDVFKMGEKVPMTLLITGPLTTSHFTEIVYFSSAFRTEIQNRFKMYFSSKQHIFH